MVTVRSNHKQSAASSCVPSYRRISNWSLLVGIFLIVVVNSAWRKVQSVATNGTIQTKQAKEIIYPLPDGTKDYNLVKENSTSFQGFSFYVMGDTPVSQILLPESKVSYYDRHFIKAFVSWILFGSSYSYYISTETGKKKGSKCRLPR